MKTLLQLIITIGTFALMWVIATDIGIDLVRVLWNSDMKFEAVLTGLLAWDCVVSFFLKLFMRISNRMEV